MAINTTVAAVVLAMRDHNEVPGVVGGGINELTPGERMVVSIFVMESARRFAGGGEDDSLFREVGRAVRDQLEEMSDEDWWALTFALHPTIIPFVHHRL